MSDRGVTSSKGAEKLRGCVQGTARMKMLRPSIMYNEQMLTGKTTPTKSIYKKQVKTLKLSI